VRILSIGNFGRSWDNSVCDEEHIAKALEDLGHKVLRWQRDDELFLMPPSIDFTLIAQWDGYSEEKLDKLPHPLVYWAFDYQADGQDWHERLINQSDIYLSKRIADSKYSNWQWLPQDFAPWFMGRHYEKPERDIEVLFTGSYLPWANERNATLSAINKRFNLQINSVNQWPDEFTNVQPPVMDTEYTKLIARAKINISIDHTLEAGYWSDRSAQIMACGGFVMMRYIPMAEVVFGQYVAWFFSVDDCIERINHYLHSEAERKVKGSMGYTHAQSHLMVKNRVQDLITIVENHLENSNV